MFKKENLNYIILFALGLLSILFIAFSTEAFAYKITREDGVIENITAIFYLAGFIVGVITIFKTKKMLLPIAWTLMCFIFLGEETSWFQRIFNYSVESVESVNAQNEFNLHNLSIFEGDDLFVDGKISRQGVINFLKSTQNIFRIFFFGYFLIIPILMSLSGKIKRLVEKLGYIKPSPLFIFSIIVVFGLSFILAIYSDLDKKMSFAETREMLYAFFIFMYIWIYVRVLRPKTA
ncbi:hypothetical protein [Winogradskyella sp. 3972H.M.0a.05]|uniref:hypothetical protein n=1 Tax=Winogradskyella sp. 3972H.M.0a.05 TaxID=2950277 RepID=UPI00339B90DD